MTHFAESAVQPLSGMARLTSRQGRLRRSDSERYPDLLCGSCIRIKELAGFKHRMHYHRQFARHSHGGSFEADPLPELETPCPQALSVELRVRITDAAS